MGPRSWRSSCLCVESSERGRAPAEHDAHVRRGQHDGDRIPRRWRESAPRLVRFELARRGVIRAARRYQEHLGGGPPGIRCPVGRGCGGALCAARRSSIKDGAGRLAGLAGHRMRPAGPVRQREQLPPDDVRAGLRAASHGVGNAVRPREYHLRVRGGGELRRGRDDVDRGRGHDRGSEGARAPGHP